MKRALFVVALIFIILSFVGAGYVFYADGQVNAGYAVIPLVFALVCAGGYVALKKENKDVRIKTIWKVLFGISAIMLALNIVAIITFYSF